MSIDFQQLLGAMVMLVPGFIVTSTRRLFRPKRFESPFEWLVTTLLHSGL